MKRYFYGCASMVLFVIFLVSGLQAQDTAYKTLPSITITPSSTVSKEVTKSFQHSFPDAKKPIWWQMNENYMVRFISKDQSNKALYSENGKLIYHLRYGKENNLPGSVQRMVQQYYPHYNITSVLFVNQDQREIWVINVENDKKLVVVRVEEGQLDEVDNYNKS